MKQSQPGDADGCSDCKLPEQALRSGQFSRNFFNHEEHEGHEGEEGEEGMIFSDLFLPIEVVLEFKWTF